MKNYMIVHGFAALIIGAFVFGVLPTPTTDDGIQVDDLIVDAGDRKGRRDGRQDDRDDRQDGRDDNRDDRQGCRQEEGLVGDDKRECKHEDGGDAEEDAEKQAA